MEPRIRRLRGYAVPLIVAVAGITLVATVPLWRIQPAPPPATPQAANPAAVLPANRPGPSGDWGSPADFGQPINRDFAGVVCFRGNAQRNYYGEGPVPRGHVQVLWRSAIGADRLEPRWNGVGWTGQPLAVEWPDPVRRHMNFLDPPGPETEIIQGALDGRVHFFDAATGERSRPALPMPYPNPIKGTVTVDPRGYPLLYVGCGLQRPRAGYRVFSLLDFRELAWLPGNDSRAPRGWPAFDSNALVVRDRLLVPGENGLFYSVALNTRWDAQTGTLRLRPQPARVPVTAAGIESSLAIWGRHAYCGDTNGNLWRIDLNRPSRVTRIRNLGDDADSTVTFDNDGTFYVGIEVDHRRSRGAPGRLYKLRAPDGDLVWQWDFPARSIYGASRLNAINGGVLSSAAVWPEGNLVFITTAHSPGLHQGSLVALDRDTGNPRWRCRMGSYAWSSPAVVGGVVVAADASGAVYVRDAATGETLLTDQDGDPTGFVEVGSTIEGSPLIWRGRIYYGVRGGAVVCLGEAPGSGASVP